MQVLEMDIMKKTTALLPLPTSTATATPSVAPIPTVVPNVPTYEVAGQSGQRTLWVSCLNHIILIHAISLANLYHLLGCLCDHAPLNSYLFLLGLESTSGKCLADSRKHAIHLLIYRLVAKTPLPCSYCIHHSFRHPLILCNGNW